MEINHYAKEASKTAIYPNIGNNIFYPTLGLVGEAGEIANKVKKIIRDKKGILGNEDRVAIAEELGDVLWYVAAIAKELRFSLDEIAHSNIVKLQERAEKNKLMETEIINEEK